MSENNGVARKKKRSLSFKQSFQLCEALRTDQELVQKMRGYEEVAAHVNAKLGFSVGVQKVAETLKMLGITIMRKKYELTSGTSRESARLRYRVLCDAVVKLYKKLGEPLCGELERIHSELQVSK